MGRPKIPVWRALQLMIAVNDSWDDVRHNRVMQARTVIARAMSWLAVVGLAAPAAGAAPGPPPVLGSMTALAQSVTPQGGSSTAGAHLDRAVHVLVVANDDPNRPYVRQALEGLRRALREGNSTAVLYTEFFDQVRFGDRPTYPEEFRAWLLHKYRDQRLDAIVVRGQGALELFARRPDSPWNDLPIVYGTLGDLTIDIRDTHPTASGVVLGNHFPLLMQTIKTILPDTRRIAAIRGAAETERSREEYWLPQIREAGFEVMDLVGLAMSDLLARVSTLPDDTAPLFLSYLRDPAGRVYEAGEAQTLIDGASNRPLFTLMNNGLTEGLVGGPTPDMVFAGHQWGVELRARLAGKPPSTITLPLSRLSPLIFDARGLRRWGIPESRLPPHSLVVNRPPSLWRDYRGSVITAAAIGIMLAVLLAVTLVERRHRAQAQTALRASYVQLQSLTDRLITAQEEERARIARDLHDDIGQRVASFSIALSRLKRQLPAEAPAAGQSVSDLQQEATRLSKELRQLSHDLHPSALEHLGLLQAIRARCNEFREESGTPVRFDVSEDWRDVPEPVALCLYRVAQEALRNVASHAHARHVVVALGTHNGHLSMRVSDDGQGFNPTAGRTGLGLVSLGERVRMLGGRLDVAAAPGTGTDVLVTLPIGGHHAAESAAR